MATGQSSVGEVRIKPDRLHAFAVAICRADGSSDEEARLVADHLVLANLFGHDSQGVGMIPHYIQNTASGACVRNHHAKIARDNGAVIVIDGGAGYGQVVAKEAMDIGIERASKHGVCVVGLINAHHIGRIGHWGEQCALAGALTGGRTHSPRTIKKDSTDIINNMLSIIIDPKSMGGTELFEDEVETFITWVKSAKPQAGVAEVLAPGEPERARRADREKNGVPIDSTTWQQLIDVARKVRLNDTAIPHTSRPSCAG